MIFWILTLVILSIAGYVFYKIFFRKSILDNFTTGQFLQNEESEKKNVESQNEEKNILLNEEVKEKNLENKTSIINKHENILPSQLSQERKQLGEEIPDYIPKKKKNYDFQKNSFKRASSYVDLSSSFVAHPKEIFDNSRDDSISELIVHEDATSEEGENYGVECKKNKEDIMYCKRKSNSLKKINPQQSNNLKIEVLENKNDTENIQQPLVDKLPLVDENIIDTKSSLDKLPNVEEKKQETLSTEPLIENTTKEKKKIKMRKFD